MAPAMTAPYILYAAECSYYSAKARAYLLAKRVPYVERPNADRGYRERARVTVGYDVIPILETPDGAIIQDTVEIIDYLEPRFATPPAYPDTAVLGWAARFLAVYASHSLIRPGLHFRWSFLEENLAFIHHEFGRTIRPRGPEEEQIAFGKKIAQRIQGNLPIMGLVPETMDAIDAACETLMTLLNRHFEEHPFLLGGHPTLADYAFMGPFYGHMARDPYPSSLMKRIAPNLFRWTERMMSPGPSPEFHDCPTTLFRDDALPATLEAILLHAVEDFAVELGQTITSLADWLEAHPEIGPGERVPAMRGNGSLASHEVSVYGVRLKVPIRANMVWEHQKTKTFYDDLDPGSRRRLDDFLSEVGALELMRQPVSRPLERENFGFVTA